MACCNEVWEVEKAVKNQRQKWYCPKCDSSYVIGWNHFEAIVNKVDIGKAIKNFHKLQKNAVGRVHYEIKSNSGDEYYTFYFHSKVSKRLNDTKGYKTEAEVHELIEKHTPHYQELLED